MLRAHILFRLWTFSLYIHCKTKKKHKNFVNFIKKGFSKFSIIEFVIDYIFENSIIHKPSLGSRDFTQKFGLDRFSRFDGYWIHTNRQTNKQTIYRLNKKKNWIQRVQSPKHIIQRNWVIAPNANSLIPLSLQFNVVDLRYFKLWILMDEIIKVWNIKGLRHLVLEI